MSIAFLFPGQGAQYPGMGKDFYDNFSVAKETFEEASDLLKKDIAKVVFTGSSDLLMETQNSQVGIFVTSIAQLRVLQKEVSGLIPDICAGLSLGEYTALVASGRLDFEHALALVEKRGIFMNEACQHTEGTMAVVLGLEAKEVERMVEPIEGLYAANFNCPGQVVISGTVQGIKQGIELAKERNAKRVLPLSVHGAFHSPLMEEAKEKLKPFILEAPLKESEKTLIMNVTGNEVSSIDHIRDNLIMQVTHPVRWEMSMQTMIDKGVQTYYEIGPGKALTGFGKRMGVSVRSIEKIGDLEK